LTYTNDIAKGLGNNGSIEKKIGYWSVVAIGIGGMVGGGIFAVLGLSVQIAHGAAPTAPPCRWQFFLRIPASFPT